LSSAAAWPLVRPLDAFAQQTAVPVIGFMHFGSAGPLAHLVAALRSGLQKNGYVEGKNVTIEFRWAEGQNDRLRAFAAEFVRRQVAVIVTGGGEGAARIAKTATSTIPIVFNVGSDPVEAGLVASIGRPGSNATGVNILTVELAAKRLGLLHEILPAATVITHLVNPNLPTSAINVREVDAAAISIGRKILHLSASNGSEIDAAFAAMAQQHVGGLLVNADPYFYSRRDQFVALAARHAIPAAYEQREYATAGGLMYYGTDIPASYRQMGSYVGLILKGAKPADLPVVQPTKFELVINLKTAKTLGLALPPGVLAIADEVIE
jgi:putative ABC transport system substrate-binding protein